MEHKHDGVIRAAVPVVGQFLFDSGQRVLTGVAHQLSIDHLPRVELKQSRSVVEDADMRFGVGALRRWNHVQGHLDVNEAPAGQQTVRHRVRFIIAGFNGINIVHAVPFSGTNHGRYDPFATASSCGGCESLDRFDGRFVPFMPNATNSARMDIIEIGAKSVVENHAEWETVVGEHVAVAVATSEGIGEISVSMERHIRPATYDFGCEYPVSRNVRHNRLIVVVDGVFDCSSNMGLSWSGNRVRRFSLHRGPVNWSARDGWITFSLVEAMFICEHADKDEERCEDEHRPSADKNEQRAERARRIAQNGQNCHYDRLRCGLLRPMFTHTLILRAGETYVLIA